MINRSRASNGVSHDRRGHGTGHKSHHRESGYRVYCSLQSFCTSDTRVVDDPVDSWLCLDTGFYEQRYQEPAFYEHQYDLQKYDLKSGRRRFHTIRSKRE
jgi:hypothetical protein